MSNSVCKHSFSKHHSKLKEKIVICSQIDIYCKSFLEMSPVLLLPVVPQGTKGFKCDVCAREFTLSANLRRHMLIHASVRPFQCHVCFKSFVQKQTLKTHMIVHLPVKPFKCKVRLQYVSSRISYSLNYTTPSVSHRSEICLQW